MLAGGEGQAAPTDPARKGLRDLVAKVAGYETALRALRDAGAGDQEEAVQIVIGRLDGARKAHEHGQPQTTRQTRALERADREAKSLLREQALAEYCDRKVAELLARKNDALGKVEACRVNLAAARQELADLAGAQPQIILPAAIRDDALWAGRAADFMREVEAAALAAAPTQPAALPRQHTVQAAAAPDVTMSVPDEEIAAFAAAQGIDLDSLPQTTRDAARAGIAAQFRTARTRGRSRSARSRPRRSGRSRSRGA